MSDHAWSRDPVRDAAVRAAEDGRDRPLPTLEEAIAAFSPSEEGLRTERVTLEIVRGDGLHVRQWPWQHILKAWGLGEEDEAESVRVVEEPKLAPNANDSGESNHAAPAASGDGEGEMSRTVQIGPPVRQDERKCTERDNRAASGGNGQETLDGSTQAARGGGEGVIPGCPRGDRA